MMSQEAKKAHAALDELAMSLKRVRALPPDALPISERLVMWAQLASLSFELDGLVRDVLPYSAKQKSGS